MPRGGRRQVAAEDDDSDHGYGLEPMSPNTKKEHDKKLIMVADLGVATANFIKTSDYNNRTMTSNLPLIRQCDIPNTEEAKVVQKNKAQSNLWTSRYSVPQTQNMSDACFRVGTNRGGAADCFRRSPDGQHEWKCTSHQNQSQLERGRQQTWKAHHSR